MADLTSEAQLCSQYAAPIPIDRLNVDIFIIVFKIMVDEEAARLRHRRIEQDVKPVVAVKLSLVCKTWKNIVYNSPSMWPVITLDLMKPSNQVQARLNRLSKRSMNAPVDLYLWRIHSHVDGGTDSSHLDADRNLCSCHDDTIAISFTNITNLHSLQAYFTTSLGPLLLKTATLPSLARLHTLTLFSARDLTNNVTFDLKSLFAHTSELVDLNLDYAGQAKIGFAEPGKPLLPKLRTLELSASPKRLASANTLIQFLSHAPNIHILTAYLTNFDNKIAVEPFPTITLPHLRQIFTQTFSALSRTFSAGKVKTPILEQFVCNYLIDTSKEECRRFLSSNPTIKKLHLRMTQGPSYTYPLRGAPNVEELKLHVPGEGEHLSLLYSTQFDAISGRSMPICPNLRRLTIVLDTALSSYSYFEELVRARCAAIDENGLTEVGYKAVEFLDLISHHPQKVYPELMRSTSWMNADVAKTSVYWYRLRWPYSPHATSSDITANTVSPKTCLIP